MLRGSVLCLPGASAEGILWLVCMSAQCVWCQWCVFSVLGQVFSGLCAVVNPGYRG